VPHARAAHRVACVLFVAASGAAYGLTTVPSTHRAAAYVALHVVLTVLMMSAWATGRVAGPAGRRWTLAAGTGARLLLIGAPAVTSHDVARYLWDGRVAFEGIDPYRAAPDDPSLAGVRATWPMPAGETHDPTSHPPGAVGLFALSSSAGIDLAPIVWKLIVTLASLATLRLVAQLLAVGGKDYRLAFVALSPLLVLEGGVGAHLDVVVAVTVAAALLFALHRPSTSAGVALGTGALLKLIPAAALVPVVFAARGAGVLRVVRGAAAVVGLGYGLALLAGWHPVGGLPGFLAHRRFGSPAFAALAYALGERGAASAAVAVIVAALVASAWLARRGHWAVGVQCALGIPLLVSPVVFPWYLALLVPGMALVPSATVLGWATTAPLTYEVLDHLAADGQWSPAAWPLACIAAVLAVGAVADLVRGRGELRARRAA
jgi:hypothetical protein